MIGINSTLVFIALFLMVLPALTMTSYHRRKTLEAKAVVTAAVHAPAPPRVRSLRHIGYVVVFASVAASAASIHSLFLHVLDTQGRADHAFGPWFALTTELEEAKHVGHAIGALDSSRTPDAAKVGELKQKATLLKQEVARVEAELALQAASMDRARRDLEQLTSKALLDAKAAGLCQGAANASWSMRCAFASCRPAERDVLCATDRVN